jgi:4,5-dihydroxyphthalate decarboxylase
MTSRATLDVSIALSDNPRTRPLIEGRTQIEGLRLLPTVLHPSEMFWRQLHFGDFDISEMSLSSLLIAASRGDRRWVAIPVYTMRRFFHTGVLVRVDSGIQEPAHLAGKRVGVPEYQQTAAIWSRGALEDEFGVPPSAIEWFMERGPDRSHGSATGFQPPPGVRLRQIGPETSIGQMLITGELDATLLYIADPNLVDRSRADVSKVTRPLFQDASAEGLRYHRATGLYPINHTLVVRRSLLEQHPWIALNLYNGFVQAVESLRSVAQDWAGPFVQTGNLDAADFQRLSSFNPMPYGLAAARRELETVAAYVHRQGLTDRQIGLEEIFAPGALEL